MRQVVWAAAPVRWGKVRGISFSSVLGSFALAAAAVVVAAGPAAATPAPGSTHFPRYKELESNVAFWSQVFTRWSSKQIAFHDVEHLDLVYSVLSIDDIFKRLPESQQEDAVRARRKAEGERITAMLQRIAGGHARTEEERRILKAIAKIGHEPSYAATLADQVRSQRGLGDKFCEAAERAEAYRPMMSRILRQYDVPQELLALPLVESGYKIGAHSHAGAAGIWQFMPATGRIYLTVSDAYDDRRDPARSTDAAARMLRKTYENLGSWPLAITSYNHGPGGIARAVKEMGTTHFGVISRHYKGKAFGFASRNYYAEFLAAVDAMQNMDKLCGAITAAPYNPDEVTLGASASIQTLANAAGISVRQLDDLNPALGESVTRGKVKVPRGYRLNLPSGTRGEFAAAFGHVERSAPTLLASADDDDASAAPPATRKHKVARGETLGQIARKYGTTETTLLWMNKLRSSKSLQTGQMLTVPAERTPTTVAVASAPARPPFSKTMTTTAGLKAAAEAGEAAATAAAVAGATAAAVVPAAVVQPAPAAPIEAAAVPAPVATREPSPDPAPAPAKAAAPEPEPAAETEAVLTANHKVGRGQTLTQIASMYRTSVDDLKKMNGITDARSVQAGQVLKVKASGSDIAAGATVGRTYKARAGDTLWTIAKANDTSVETIKRLNPKVASAGLKAGDTIKVPSAGAVSVASAAVASDESPKKSSAKAAAPAKVASKSSAKAAPKASYRSHRVQKGQTLSSIAQKYKTSVDTLKRLNGIRDAKNVQAGKTLKVPL